MGALKKNQVKLLQKTTMDFFDRALGRLGQEMARDPQLVIRYLKVAAVAIDHDGSVKIM